MRGSTAFSGRNNYCPWDSLNESYLRKNRENIANSFLARDEHWHRAWSQVRNRYEGAIIPVLQGMTWECRAMSARLAALRVGSGARLVMVGQGRSRRHVHVDEAVVPLGGGAVAGAA